MNRSNKSKQGGWTRNVFLGLFIVLAVGISLFGMLGGFTWLERKIFASTGSYTKTCVDGVSYLQFHSGATVQYDQSGKVVLCK